MVPDYTMIAEVSLHAAGFQSAHMLATKLVSCMKVGAWRMWANACLRQFTANARQVDCCTRVRGRQGP